MRLILLGVSVAADPCSPITIRGERHSGTNAIRALISSACPCSPFRYNRTHDYDGVLGWKHGINIGTMPFSGQRLIVYRGAVSWLRHMARDTYEARYYDEHGPMDPDVVLLQLVNNPFPAGIDGGPDFASAVSMRQKKYEKWHQYALKHDAIEITYEQFAAQPNSVLERLRARGLRCRLDTATVYVSRQASRGRRNRLPQLDEALLRIVYNALNTTFEHEIGLMTLRTRTTSS